MEMNICQYSQNTPFFSSTLSGDDMVDVQWGLEHLKSKIEIIKTCILKQTK